MSSRGEASLVIRGTQTKTTRHHRGFLAPCPPTLPALLGPIASSPVLSGSHVSSWRRPAPPCVSPALAGSVVWAPHKGGTAGQVGTGRPRSRGRPDPGLTCKRTGSPRPRLSETTSVMAVLRTVARNVLTPKTKAQSSFEREDAIWKLKEKAGGHAARGTADATVPRGHPVGARGQPRTQCWARPTKAT